ncbi:MAG: PorT family protein [Cyclobacteriaceae bacterium]|nr:PorT family protein [Cyclobacteriaceae bacterium]
MKPLLLLVCLCFGLLVSWDAQSQVQSGQGITDCDQKLELATSEFNAGHFFGLPSILKDCLNGSLSTEQTIRANLLLCQAYLVMDDPLAAEASYLRLLKADPEYVATPEKDPIEVVYLSKKFTSRPIFTPHYGIGVNLSLYRSIYEINPFSLGGATTRRTSRLGVQALAGVEWNPTDFFSVGAEAILATGGFKTITHKISDADDFVGIEKQTWLNVPLYLKYQKPLGKIRPYGYAGMSLNLLFRSTMSSMEFRNNSSSDPTFSGVGITTGSDKSVLYQRRLLTRSVLIGGGVKYKVGVNFLYVDVRYSMGLNNLTRPETLYYDSSDGTTLSSLVTSYEFIGNFFRLDNMYLSVGYVMPVYDPRKIKTSSGWKLFKWKRDAEKK